MAKYIIGVIGAQRAYECEKYTKLSNGNICITNPRIFTGSSKLVPLYEVKHVEIPAQLALIERLS